VRTVAPGGYQTVVVGPSRDPIRGVSEGPGSVKPEPKDGPDRTTEDEIEYHGGSDPTGRQLQVEQNPESHGRDESREGAEDGSVLDAAAETLPQGVVLRPVDEVVRFERREPRPGDGPVSEVERGAGRDVRLRWLVADVPCQKQVRRGDVAVAERREKRSQQEGDEQPDHGPASRRDARGYRRHRRIPRGSDPGVVSLVTNVRTDRGDK
jgi:hypothetical protein